jgi:hypothetical protein
MYIWYIWNLLTKSTSGIVFWSILFVEEGYPVHGIKSYIWSCSTLIIDYQCKKDNPVVYSIIVKFVKNVCDYILVPHKYNVHVYYIYICTNFIIADKRKLKCLKWKLHIWYIWNLLTKSTSGIVFWSISFVERPTHITFLIKHSNIKYLVHQL